MPIISRAHDPEELIRQGLIIDSIISHPESEPSDEGYPVKMLVDTGASISGISGEIAEEIGLPQVGVQEMGTAGGTVETTVYTGKVMFEPQHLGGGPKSN